MKSSKHFPKNPTKIIIDSSILYNNTASNPVNIDNVYNYFHNILMPNWIFLIDFYNSIATEKPYDFIHCSYRKASGVAYPFRELPNSELRNYKFTRKNILYFQPVATLFNVPILAACIKNISILLKMVNEVNSGTRDKFIYKEDIAELFKNISQEDIEKIKNKVDKACDNFLEFYSSQSTYSPADMFSSSSTASINCFILSNFLEYYISVEDTERIFKIFETIHIVGNKKATNFSKCVKKKNNKPRSAEQPIEINGFEYRNYYYLHIWPETFEYYLLLFYSQYENGKFMNHCINKNGMLTEFVFNIYRSYNDLYKYREKNIPKYCKLFNKIKTKDCFTLEQYMFIYKLTTVKFDNHDDYVDYMCNVLNQNMDITNLCLTNESLSTYIGDYMYQYAYYMPECRNIFIRTLHKVLLTKNESSFESNVCKLCKVLANYFMYSTSDVDNKYKILELIYSPMKTFITKNSFINYFSYQISDSDNDKIDELKQLIILFRLN